MTHKNTHHEYVATEKTFYVAHGPSVHFGKLEEGQTLATGQETLETFTSILSWRRRVIELGGSFD